jgi:hypothetical protein
MLREVRFCDLSVGRRFVRHDLPSSQCSFLSRHLAFALLPAAAECTEGSASNCVFCGVAHSSGHSSADIARSGRVEQTAAAPRARIRTRRRVLIRRLGGDLGVANPFPPKPKGMHWRRYCKACRRASGSLRVSSVRRPRRTNSSTSVSRNSTTMQRRPMRRRCR